MFKTFFLTELKYTFKQPMVYIFLGLITIFAFAFSCTDAVSIGGAVGNVHKNSPHEITRIVNVCCLFGLLMAAAYFNNAALRDYKNNFNEILFTTALSKPGYYFGRFFGALVLSTIPILGVFIGVWLGSIMGPMFHWIEAERFGSFHFSTVISNYFIFILPNMFFAGSIIYALSHAFKNTIISFVGAITILVGYIISSTLTSDLESETLATLIDSLGNNTFRLTAKYYTPIEKNTLNPSFSGLLLLNRLVWIAVGFLISIGSYLSFSFRKKSKKGRAVQIENSTVDLTEISAPAFSLNYSIQASWTQFKSFFKISFLSITKSITFKILIFLSMVLLISNLFGGSEAFGLKSYPLTYKLIDTITGSTSLFIVIILVFFSGELVWRDRDNKINEVIDATPHVSFNSLAAKALSLLVISSLLHLFFMVCGILYQLGNGYTNIEMDVYLLDFLSSSFFTYFIWSGVMILIQVLLNNKYIGYAISILVIFVWNLILSMLDIQSNMLAIGGGPSLRYSDMNGFGPGVEGAMWFNLYWALFAVICLFIAGALWNRGTVSALKERIVNSKKSIPKSSRLTLLSLVVIWTAVAGFVYYNTQILNPYKTSDQQEELSVQYELKYKKYQHVNLPKISDAKYFIDIYPHQRNANIKAILQLTNTSTQPIDSIHFSTDSRWNPKINLAGSELVFEDKELDYYIYQLKTPLKPGATITLEIKESYESNGFGNTAAIQGVIENGTFLNNLNILPSIGYSDGGEISDKNTRRKHELPPKDRMPELEANCGSNCMKNYLSDGKSDFINVETVISTSSDQIAIAPGTLIKKWEEKGRNYYHYKVDHPSQNFYSFISARYEVASRKWNGIDIEVYYDKKHPWNVEMMLDAVQRSLKYYTENFGPYYHKQCRVIEFPRYASFAQAFPGTMPYSESIGFVYNLEDEGDNNIVDAVIAHEMAHQWWAHQVVGATMQGATMFSESFAEYSSLMTMKGIAKTPMKMREFIKHDHNRYLRGRSGEVDKELPLYKVENQQHIHYGKGSVILYALQDYIGEDSVNAAMRSFLEEYRYKPPPYPTSLDFLRHLEARTPDSMQYLIDDWIKDITLYDNRMKEANAKKLANGKYEITVNLESNKMKADTMGNETKVPMSEWIDIGFFSDDDEEDLMFEKRVKMSSGASTWTFELDSLPAKAAIDPRMLLIDRVYDDNIKSVKTAD